MRDELVWQLEEGENLVWLDMSYEKVRDALKYIEMQYGFLSKKHTKLAKKIEKALNWVKVDQSMDKMQQKAWNITKELFDYEAAYIRVMDVAKQLGYLDQLLEEDGLNKPDPEVEEKIREQYEKRLKEARDKDKIVADYFNSITPDDAWTKI